MCAFIIPLILMAAAAAAADDAKRRADHAIKDRFKREESAAKDQQALDQEVLADQRKQTDAQSAEAASERVLQSNAQLGHLQAVAGESGLQGASQSKILSEARGTAETDLSTIEANRTATNRQNDLNVKGVNSRTKHFLASLVANPTQNRIGDSITLASNMYSYASSSGTSGGSRSGGSTNTSV